MKNNNNNYGSTLIILVLIATLLNVVKTLLMVLIPLVPSIVAVTIITITMFVFYFVKYKETKTAKLAVLRQLIIAILTIAEAICEVCKDTKIGVYRYPLKWLCHFLKGTGTAMEVPAELVQQAHTALVRGAVDNNYGNDTECGKFCVNSSTLYKGRGFYGRPSLFYVMGGFTFRIYKHGDSYIVSGNDYYDWHSNKSGNYFTSPLGDKDDVIMHLIVKIMGKIFGEDLFVTNGWPSGECGISNKLWEEMYQVGAKSFHSYFKNVPFDLTDNEYEAIRWEDRWALEKEDAYCED